MSCNWAAFTGRGVFQTKDELTDGLTDGDRQATGLFADLGEVRKAFNRAQPQFSTSAITTSYLKPAFKSNRSARYTPRH